MKQYQKFFQIENASLEFAPGALRSIARKAMKRDVGARALRGVIEDLMLAMLFELPEQKRPGSTYHITEEMVDNGSAPSSLRSHKGEEGKRVDHFRFRIFDVRLNSSATVLRLSQDRVHLRHSRGAKLLSLPNQVGGRRRHFSRTLPSENHTRPLPIDRGRRV